MEDGDTPRRRTRRPPKQYQGTISWEQAEQMVKSNEHSEKSNGRRVPASMNFEEEGANEGDSDGYDDNEAMAYNLEDPEDLSMDDWQEGDGNTSDEFVPDPSSSKEKRHHRGRVTEDAFDDDDIDSGEEYASSEENNIDPELRHDDVSPRRQPSKQQHIQHSNDMTATERLDRARKRRWHPPAGHGGMENPEAWKEAGQRNRQMQAGTREAEKESDVDIEVEGQELQ
jgi:hypothetical protein